MIEQIEGALQPDFTGALDGCFDMVVLDERHIVKSLQAKGSLSVSWLRSQKYFFIIVTPMRNSIDDLKGEMPFLEPEEGESWWSDESPREPKFEGDANPFDLPDDHPAAKLQLTRRAVRNLKFRDSR